MAAKKVKKIMKLCTRCGKKYEKNGVMCKLCNKCWKESKR